MSRASNVADEAQAAAAKLTPPVLLASAQISGWGPQEWMYALTALYVVLQTFYLVWKWLREARKPPDDDADE